MLRVLLLISSLLLTTSSYYKKNNRHNFLLIVSEDNGPELGCYGTPISTPNIDQLARDGFLFEKAYVTQAGCSQSRASFLTGLYPHQNGQIGLATWKYKMFNAEIPNIPKSLKTAGYSTGIIGKIHVNPESAFPFDFKEIRSSNFKREKMNLYIEKAFDFFSKSKKPFFLQVNFPDAHAPFLKQVDNIPKKPLNASEVKPIPYMGIDHPKIKELTANYYNCLMRLDIYIGELINVLKKSGKYENTVIIYMGDHGADMLRGKRTSYEGGLRIPLIINWPSLKSKPLKISRLVSSIDLYPTILDIAGLKVPNYLPGKSLLGLIKNKNVKWREFLYTEYHVHSNHNPYPQRTVRNDRHKLVWNPLSGIKNPGYEFTLSKVLGISEGEILEHIDTNAINAYSIMKNPPEYELYDLINDPYEFNNIAGKNENVLILENMKNALHNWQKESNDPLIDKSLAKKLFNSILKVGTDIKPRVLVPYLDLLKTDQNPLSFPHK